MDRKVAGDEFRLSALYNRLGRLWSEQPAQVWDEVAPSHKIEECRLTLVGKILNDPSVNFLAFQNTMKLIWRTDLVDISQGGASLYIVKFQTEQVKQRVLENSPWLFANHLVILKPWRVNTPLHCYDFTTCEFWVQVFGLPLERCTENMISKVVAHIGRVVVVRIEHKDGAKLKVGKARVEMDLQKPLKTGLLIKVEGKNLWLDFRYERLSHYCYSYGKLGHDAMSCKDFPYDESKMDEKDSLLYGSWLKAEVRAHSPFWRTFYDENHPRDAADESIPETPQPPSAIIPVQDSPPAVPEVQVQTNRGKQPMDAPDCNQIITSAKPLQWQPMVEEA
ncbi:hypothetical protein EUGRSUZ_D02404 [Eucalyptus grandis]|uniref:DUF4283 domain-containing protein n=2 Tax=Eucalyptus grandis TaxID=71139 RepID=A0A059CIZ8_EUCGR|nr:hypothetical protein EUGRSUZ_D02404 [Eucalyptus grandis]